MNNDTRLDWETIEPPANSGDVTSVYALTRNVLHPTHLNLMSPRCATEIIREAEGPKMPNLISHRLKIDERVAVLEPPLGLDIVQDLLVLSREKAIEWIKAHGDPTEMPAAVVLLAHQSKVNADVIMATCFDMQRERRMRTMQEAAAGGLNLDAWPRT